MQQYAAFSFKVQGWFCRPNHIVVTSATFCVAVTYTFWSHMIGFAPVLHITKLRIRKDKQCALGSRFSLCCLLKMLDVIEAGKGTDFLF